MEMIHTLEKVKAHHQLNVICLFLLSVILGACVSTPVTSLPTHTSTSSIVVQLPTSTPPITANINIAPNKLWGSHRTTSAIQVLDASDGSVLAQVFTNPIFGPNLLLDSWSPNSLYFVLISYDAPFRQAYVTGFFVFQYDPIKRKLSYVSIQSPNDSDRIDTAWSPDSSQLAVTFNWVEFRVLDPYGREIQRIIPPTNFRDWVASHGWVLSR
jgi:hypothetical protein